MVADVTTEEGCRLAVSDESTPTPDGLVLNVGTGFGMGVAGTSLDEWDRTFALNFMLSKFMSWYAGRWSRCPTTRRLSSSARWPDCGTGSRIPAYDAVQGGSHRAEPARGRRGGGACGIRANVLAPGLFDTPLGRAASAGRPSRTRTPVPLGRQGTAWEVAAAAVFLAPVGRGQLHHRPGTRRRRGPHPGMSAHSAEPRSGWPPAPPPRLGRRMARFNRAVTNKVSVHLAGLLPGMGIVVHVGRRTRTVYRTPVNVLRTKDGFRIPLTYGRDSEWVRNALAHGAVRLVTRGREYELSEPQLVVDPDRQHVPRLPRAILRFMRVSEFLDFRGAV